MKTKSLLWQSTWHTSTCQCTTLPTPFLSPPRASKEQTGAKVREPLSFSKGDGISELNDKVKEAFGEQGGGISFLYLHTTLGPKAPVYYTQRRLELIIPN